MKFFTVIVSLLVVATFPAFGQKAVQVETWEWKPSDVTELQKVIDGKPSKVFKIGRLAKEHLGHWRALGYKHVRLLWLTDSIAPMYDAFLLKVPIERPTQIDCWKYGVLLGTYKVKTKNGLKTSWLSIDPHD